MPISLGSAYLTLRVKGDEFKAGLGKAKTQAATTTKGIGQSFANVQQKIQGAAAVRFPCSAARWQGWRLRLGWPLPALGWWLAG